MLWTCRLWGGVIIGSYKRRGMDDPTKATVELTKEEKLKQLNDRLNNMLKLKKVDPLTLHHPITHPPHHQQPNHHQPQLHSSHHQHHPQNYPDKAKKIKKLQKVERMEKVEKHTLRKVAGEVWEDKTMEEWPENDFRIFCGNLGNQVNDQILGSVFRRYGSFQMARVVRDRRTGKTRGYGFVSFLNPNDFLTALKEMNGKHVGNRPVKLMKSNWKDRDLNSAKNEYLPSDFKKNSQKQTHKICLDYKYVSPL